jgi:hypothetical protein
MGQVGQIIEQLTTGKLDTGQAADKLRKVRLADRQRPQAAWLMTLGQDDPSGYPVEDDGHEIADAYHDGKLNLDQYRVLTQAASGAPARGR